MGRKREQLVYPERRGRLAYLCLQATREGQASHAHVHEIIRGLKRRGWEVRLFEPNYNRLEKPLPGLFARLLQFFLTQIKLWISRRPDILYVRQHFATWPTAIWARLMRIPVVQEVNGPYEDLFTAWPFTRGLASLFKWLMRTQLRWAEAVIAVTPQLADWVKKEAGNTNVYVVPNGANIELFKPDAPLFTSATLPEKFVIFFGALAAWQGIETMLEAVECREWPSEVKLMVIGDGKMRNKVQLAAERGKVIYLGIVPYRCVPGIVARSIAALSPQNSLSKAGLFPLKVLEALSCGVPVIVTDFPGMADLIRENGCGVVIPPNDARALAEAVAYLYHNPDIRARMGKAGRRLVVQGHSWDSRSAETDAILHRLLRIS